MDTNNYLYKALDAYPYDLEETMESLNYALSYEQEDQAQVLCLLGRVYADKFQDYEKALNCFEEALGINPQALKVHEYYIETLIDSEQFGKANDFIAYAIRLKGADKGMLYHQKALIAESKFLYEEALILNRKAQLNSYNEEHLDFLKNNRKRIKQKKKWRS